MCRWNIPKDCTTDIKFSFWLRVNVVTRMYFEDFQIYHSHLFRKRRKLVIYLWCLWQGKCWICLLEYWIWTRSHFHFLLIAGCGQQEDSGEAAPDSGLHPADHISNVSFGTAGWCGKLLIFLMVLFLLLFLFFFSCLFYDYDTMVIIHEDII